MNKKILIALGMVACLTIPTTVKARVTWNYGSWLLESGTEIYGYLFKPSGSTYTYEAGTDNKTMNGNGAWVKIYATAAGNTIPGSEAIGRAAYNAVARASAANAQYWGSGHSTRADADRYEWLYLSTQ